MSGPADDGVPKDDWLRAALRHAPDADAAPPPAVSDAILRAAHEQASAGRAAPPSPAVRPPILQALREMWAWLARPPVAAGFATVMVATVITLMWWDRPLEERSPPREGPSLAQAPEPAADRTPALAQPTAPPAAVAQAPAAQAPAAKVMPRPAPAATPARQAELQRRADAQRDKVLGEREATTAAKAQDVERRARAETDRAIASATPPAGAAARPESVVPAEAPTATVTADAANAGSEPAPAARAERRSAAPAAPAPAAQTQGFARRDVAAPLGMLRTTIATEPERWSWRRDAGAPAPMNTPVMQWLQRVGETTRGRWVVPDGPPEVGAAPAATLALLRDGRLHTTLRLGAGGIEVEGTSPRLRAELPAAEATALRVELDQAAR